MLATHRPHGHARSAPEYGIRFPTDVDARDQDAEFCEVFAQNAWTRIRLHDYHEIYRRPGLYEQLFYRVLKCDSPRRVVGLLGSVLEERRVPSINLSVIDVGAGNGLVGEELRRLGVGNVIGVDILPEAAEAARRDRAGIYDDYLVADLTALEEHESDSLTAFNPNCLIVVAALGFGDIPTPAFATAYNAIADDGWLAFNIRDQFLSVGDASGFATLMHRMNEQGLIRVEATQRYTHRLNIRGEPIEYVAIVARKLAPLPESWYRSTDERVSRHLKPSRGTAVLA